MLTHGSDAENNILQERAIKIAEERKKDYFRRKIK